MINFKSPHKLASLPESEPVLLALSGGADSSALLALLSDYCQSVGCKLYAAHVDHNIRENEHERDREFCKTLAKKYGAELFVLEADVPKIAKESGESLELAARRVRYEFFAEIMKAQKIKILATAHNADDNLETVIFNLTRGTGIAGVCGIPKTRKTEGGVAVRPILETEKKDILEFCRKNSVPYVEDCTNKDDSYSRNRIRLNVIPELKAINPAAAEAASRLSESAALDLDFIKSSARALIEPDGSIDVKKLLSSHEALARHAIAEAFADLSGASLENVHVESVLGLCRGGKSFAKISLPREIAARIECGKLRFIADEKTKPQNENFEILLSNGKNTVNGHIILCVCEQNNKNIYKSETQITIESAKIKGALRARNRRAGDKIKVNGVRRELRKLISEKKIPPELRPALPVVCDDEEILWVPGVAAADKTKITKGSREFISLLILPKDKFFTEELNEKQI